MVSAKQLAALKKGRAALAKKRAKKVAPKKKRKATKKKRVGTSQTKPSQLTKKKPSKRLKKRRAKNTAAGYYPNPRSKTGYQMIVVKGKKTIGWWNGHAWEDNAANSRFYGSLALLKRDLTKAKKITPDTYGIAAEPVKKL